jgi:hypothetical protein
MTLKKPEKQEKPTASHTPKHRPVAPSIPRKIKKPTHGQDIVPPGRVMPSPTARPVITPTLQGDNTLTKAPTAPMVHKRIMVSQPPSGIATQEEIQSIGLEVPAGKDTTHETGAPEIQAAALKASNRPARPLMVKPVAAGPTIAELLKAKQQSTDKSTEKPSAPIKSTVTSEPVKPAEADKTAIKPEKVIAPPSAHARPKPANKTPEPAQEQDADAAAEATADSPKSTDIVAPASPADSLTTPTETAKADSELDGLDQDLGTTDDKTMPAKAELYGGKSVLIVHERHPVRDFMAGLLVFIVGLAVILIALNFLLDAGIVKTGYKLPHTYLLEP